MQQDELAQLFSASMSLTQAPPPPLPQPQQQQQQQPITYISQHYTHSHHIVPVHQDPEPVKTHIDASELEGILLRNSIDPSLLFPSQIVLFQNADDDQRLRLLELWRISPPAGRQGYPAGVDYNTSRQLYDWPPSSLAQEETMAKLRYEKMEAQRVQEEEIQKHQRELDQSMQRHALSPSPDGSNAEPYIVSGYDMMAKREYEASAKYSQATDPVYNSHTGKNGGLWEKNVGSILDMENQYGAYAHARDYDTRPIYHDEMVM